MSFELFKSLEGQSTRNSPSPVTRWLDGILEKAIAPGHLVFVFPIRAEMLNPVGKLHGGMLAAMFDDTLGAAVFSLTENPAYATINLSVDYLSSAKEGDAIRLIAKVVRNGRRIIHLSGEAYRTSDNVLIGRAQTNLLNTQKV